MEHNNLVEAVRLMELLLRDEVCICREAVKAEAIEREALEARIEKQWKLALKEEAARVERHLENQIGLMRTELLGALRDLRLALSEVPPEELQEKAQEAAVRRPATATGRSLPAQPPATLTPLPEQPHQERLARLDEAIESEVAARAELDRRLQKEMADLSHQLRMAVALGMEDSHRRVLASGQLQQDLQEPEGGARCFLSSRDWSKPSKKDLCSEVSESLDASETKDFGFGRLHSLLRAQQQQQRQQVLGATSAVPAAPLPAAIPPPPVPPPAEGPWPTAAEELASAGLMQEQEDLRRAGAVCEAVRHDALRGLLRHGSRNGSRSRGRPVRLCGDFGSKH